MGGGVGGNDWLVLHFFFFFVVLLCFLNFVWLFSEIKMVKKKCQCIVFTLGSHVLWQVYLHTRKEKKKKKKKKIKIQYHISTQKKRKSGCVSTTMCVGPNDYVRLYGMVSFYTYPTLGRLVNKRKEGETGRCWWGRCWVYIDTHLDRSYRCFWRADGIGCTDATGGTASA